MSAVTYLQEKQVFTSEVGNSRIFCLRTKLISTNAGEKMELSFLLYLVNVDKSHNELKQSHFDCFHVGGRWMLIIF